MFFSYRRVFIFKFLLELKDIKERRRRELKKGVKEIFHVVENNKIK
jgi:hypothetical protein